MQSTSATVTDYLASLPGDRREALEAVRRVMLANLDADVEEGMQYGMIGYYVPHRVFPAGYHCDPKQPLPFAGLASQKNYMSLYLMCDYGRPEIEQAFRETWAKTGKKLDMGKCCIRFKKLEDLALDVIARALRERSVEAYVAHYERTVLAMRARRKGAKPATPAKAVSSAKRATQPPAAERAATSKTSGTGKSAAAKSRGGAAKSKQPVGKSRAQR